MDNMYHAAWAWAGDSPFRYTKLVASDWGGTRTPMVISWPKRIKPDKKPRPQFTHVNDVVPTIYEILGIRPPKVVDGHEQDPIDGVSFVYTFDSADAPERKKTQYFDCLGSRGIYHDGWMASTFGPRKPWEAALPNLASWDPMQDQWELFDTRSDYSLMNDLASEHPEKLEELKALFMREAEENKVLPIGGALYTGLNPQEMKRSTNTEWTFFEGITRIPESQAPNVRNGNLRAEIEAEVPEGVNGVIFAMGGYAGGVSLYALDGVLYYEYSALLLRRDKIEVGPLPEGEVTIAFEMKTPLERAAPAELEFWINGKKAATGGTHGARVTASETHVGMDTSRRSRLLRQGALHEGLGDLRRRAGAGAMDEPWSLAGRGERLPTTSTRQMNRRAGVSSFEGTAGLLSRKRSRVSFPNALLRRSARPWDGPSSCRSG
jgi:hypothetical protein